MANPILGLCVARTGTVRQTLGPITKGGWQIALVVEEDNRLAGIVTDSNIRKALLRGVFLEAPVIEAMNRSPIPGWPGMERAEAVELMRARSIRHLPIVGGEGRLVDLLFLGGRRGLRQRCRPGVGLGRR